MNEQQRRAVVFGSSLIMESVRASLAALPGLEVVDGSLDVSLEPDLAERPATVIFDLEAIQPEFLLSFFRHPGLQLVAMDPRNHRALVWSGRQAAAMMAADLVGIIFNGEGSRE